MKVLILFWAALFFSSLFFPLFPAQAAGQYHYAAFEALPVLHEGRLKPLDSFARTYLRQFSGAERTGDMSAAAWLAESVFDPAHAAERRIFLIEDKALKEKLSLSATTRTVFSFADLQESLRMTAREAARLQRQDPEKLPPLGRKLLDLHNNILLYSQLLRSLSLILPLDIDVPDPYNQKEEESGFVSYLDLLKIRPKIEADLQKIILKKGSRFSRYSRQEKNVATLAQKIEILRDGAQHNALFRIMPIQWDKAAQDWEAPWPMLEDGRGSPLSADYLRHWQAMAAAYREQDLDAWNRSSEAALHFIALAMPENFSLQKQKAEILYNRVNFFQAALCLYLLTLLAGAAGFFFKKIRLSAPASGLLSGALIAHITGLLLRIYILGRPPVGTLYESVLFVSLICAGAALFAGLKHHNKSALYMGALSAALLLLLSPLTLKQGDTMTVLVAVLNTNFWLATHVIIITAGYGVCILTACFAHFYLFAAGQKSLPQARLKTLSDTLYHFTLASLLLTSTGTALGGVWADQSWGRFWGWDPKENGALLIVLWLIWLLHGRRAGKITESSFTAGLASLNIIVALSWFGVNLLGVGLHSYGFANGLLGVLTGFCLIETLFITALWRGYAQKEKD